MLVFHYKLQIPLFTGEKHVENSMHTSKERQQLPYLQRLSPLSLHKLTLFVCQFCQEEDGLSYLLPSSIWPLLVWLFFSLKNHHNSIDREKFEEQEKVVNLINFQMLSRSLSLLILLMFLPPSEHHHTSQLAQSRLNQQRQHLFVIFPFCSRR